MILLLLKEIWETNRIPESWRCSRVAPILKSGKDRELPDSYRYLHIIPILCKVMCLWLLRRCQEVVEVKEVSSVLQFGFKSNSSCQHTTLLLSELLEMRRERGEKTYVGFLDVRNAFPSVPRELILLRALRKLGQSRVIRIICSLYEADRAVIRSEGESSREWENIMGVKTGDPLSPLLFILFFDGLVESLTLEGRGVMVGDTKIPCLLLADDVGLLAGDYAEAQASLDCAARWATANGLTFSTDGVKSAVMLYGGSRAQPSGQWLLGSKPIEQVQQYKYLGTWMEDTYSGKVHLDKLKASMRRKLGMLRRVGVGSWMDVWTSRRVIMACLAPVVEYSAVAWYTKLSQRSRDSLESEWNRVIRLIAGTHGSVNMASLRLALGLHSLHERWMRAMLMSFHHLLSLPPCAPLRRVVDERRIWEQGQRAKKGPMGFLAWTRQILKDLGMPELAEKVEVVRGISKLDWKSQINTCLVEFRLKQARQGWSPLGDWLASRVLLEDQVGAFQSCIAGRKSIVNKMLLELATSSLPTQSCRQTVKYLRKGGAEADTICLLCQKGEETLEHLVMQCQHLSKWRLGKWHSLKAVLEAVPYCAATRRALSAMWVRRCKTINHWGVAARQGW